MMIKLADSGSIMPFHSSLKITIIKVLESIEILHLAAFFIFQAGWVIPLQMIQNSSHTGERKKKTCELKYYRFWLRARQNWIPDNW